MELKESKKKSAAATASAPPPTTVFDFLNTTLASGSRGQRSELKGKGERKAQSGREAKESKKGAASERVARNAEILAVDGQVRCVIACGCSLCPSLSSIDVHTTIIYSLGQTIVNCKSPSHIDCRPGTPSQ